MSQRSDVPMYGWTAEGDCGRPRILDAHVYRDDWPADASCERCGDAAGGHCLCALETARRFPRSVRA